LRFIAQCKKFAVIINWWERCSTSTEDDSTVACYDNFVTRKIDDAEAPRFEFGECYSGDQTKSDEADKKLIHVSVRRSDIAAVSIGGSRKAV